MVKDREAVVDIESNRSECEQVTRGKRVKNMLRSLGFTWSFKGLDGGENIDDANANRDIESLVNDKFEGAKRENSNNINMPVIGKTNSKEKQKCKNSKKACKPPRPRRGPTLSASDMRLVKEISELVMKKRARNERLKSMKRLRSARLASTSAEVASSSISIFAMIITVLFLFVIIFQAIIRGL